ncbi:MAG: hypothetical protein ACPMAG_02060 [Limisphaerales bacterium]
MRPIVKLILYIGLAASALFFGLAFKEIYTLKAQHLPVPQDLSMGMSGFAALLCLILLGILIGRDISSYLADKAVKFIFDDEGEAMKTPEYEKAEEVWKNGDYLEAIRILREYYEKHPREIYVALRIAEIYENDLHNPLAAALEYEQILKHKLPPEPWGWAAIHLVNLYGKLGQTEKGTTLLQQINERYPFTAAAKKARQRLGLPEPEPSEEPNQQQEQSGEAQQEEQKQQKPRPQQPQLPPGFRPKK